MTPIHVEMNGGEIVHELSSGGPAIGHELIHALHATRGEGAYSHEVFNTKLHTIRSWDFVVDYEESFTWKDFWGKTRTELLPTEELRTIGLGRFADEHFSENALRAEGPQYWTRRITFETHP